MQADQTFLSLRPGGGTRGGSRVFGPRFGSLSAAAANSDLPLLRPHGDSAVSSLPSFKTGESRFEGHERIRFTKDMLLQLREVAIISEDILRVKQEVEAEFFGVDPSWSRGETNLPSQAQTRYSEPDNRDWRNRSAQLPAPVEERSWETIKDRDFSGRFDPRQQDGNQYNKQDQMNSQFARSQFSSNQGVAPTLIKAEVPWSARRGTLSEEDRVLKTVKGILNKLTPEKFDLLKGQLIDSGITTGNILKVLRSFIMQHGLIVWVFVKQELLGNDPKVCPAEENVEAVCQFFNTIGKQLDENQKSKRINDMYFDRLKELAANPQLAARLRFMVRNVLDLRTNNWVPRREEVKAKTISEIHTEAEKNMGLRPGATAGMRNNRAVPSGGAQGSISPSGYINRPGAGGMMPGMPGIRKMPGMPGIDDGNWEVPKPRSMPRGAESAASLTRVAQPPLLNQRLLPQGTGGFISGKTSAFFQGSGAPPPAPATQVPPPTVSSTVVPSVDKPLAAPLATKPNTDVLKRKTISLLEEYFSVRLLDEALQCVEELKSPAYHPEFVKEALSLGFEKGSSFVEPIAKLLEYLFSKNVLSADDVKTGFLLYAELLEDLAIDLPKAPSNFGEIIGKLVLARGLIDFNAVKEILSKIDDGYFKKAVFTSAMKTVGSETGGKEVMDAQASDIAACESLF
ncbi:PREDICTED: eukaryotic translation initiation factor isoform 4G-1-like [Erythranthe guttata]|nr:PREDICTED: eukaryotic translation initiation factor isoform 4G-1-like [Erythranthe guttata]|eukprot:XP_012841046.1 PREDICTED: eukaryotic translation initiation factor isoform 4G-1-like [Erythranthe guttata]